MLGATNDNLAEKFKVATFTITRWMTQYLDFRAAIKKGREKADEDVAISLYRRAIGYYHDDVHISNYKGVITITQIIKYYPPDTAAAFIWLKNRRPDLWRDRYDSVPIDWNDAGLKMREAAKAMREKTNGTTAEMD